MLLGSHEMVSIVRVFENDSHVSAGFTGRQGGVSVGPRMSLNLGLVPGSDPNAVSANWCAVADAICMEASRIAILEQVHQDTVVEVHEGLGGLVPVDRADAAFTMVPGILLAVRTADCVPVLLVGDDIVGVVHAGWRGVAAGLLTKTVEQMRRHSMSRLRVAIGPHIRGESFEVGDEVVQAIVATGVEPDQFVVRTPGPKPHVSLEIALLHELRHAQVGVDYIDTRCTMKSNDLFSYRRDGADTGRLAGVVGLCG